MFTKIQVIENVHWTFRARSFSKLGYQHTELINRVQQYIYIYIYHSIKKNFSLTQRNN